MVMGYEPKKNGRCTCRLVVRGDMEPDEWLNTPTDSPTTMSSTIKTLLACGPLEVDARNDITSAGDVDRAFCKSLLFGPEDRRRFVCHRCHKTGVYGFGNSEEESMARKMQQSDGGIPSQTG